MDVEPPTLTANGQTGHVYVAVRYSVFFDSPDGVETAYFPNDSCIESQTTTWQIRNSAGYSFPYTASYQSRWVGDDTSRGNCVTVTWRENPTLTMDGQTGHILVPVLENVLFDYPDGAEAAEFLTADCSGDILGSWGAAYDSVSMPNPTTRSFQARWAGDDNTRGNCVTVTWTNTPPTLTANGSTESVTVPVGTNVILDYPTTAEVALFDSADCAGDPAAAWILDVHESHWVSPRSIAFQARWAGDDSTRGNCVSVTWEAIGISVLASELCGDNNDEVTLPAAQPGITIEDDGWFGNVRVINLVAQGDYEFPPDTVTRFEFTDRGDCLTADPIPPRLTAICGPINDVVTIPDQPANVFTDDSGWVNNQRTITFTPAEGYALPASSANVVALTDANVDCVVEPIGKMVTVNFQTSDGGSIEGTSYSIYAPVASQVTQPVFAEGMTGPENQIVLEGIIPGDYRLVSSPDGYEPVDTILCISDSADAQEITVEVTALQIPVPTVAPTEVPAPTAAVVSGLPETGAGTESGFGMLALTGLLAAAFLTLTGVNARRRA